MNILIVDDNQEKVRPLVELISFHVPDIDFLILKSGAELSQSARILSTFNLILLDNDLGDTTVSSVMREMRAAWVGCENIPHCLISGDPIARKEMRSFLKLDCGINTVFEQEELATWCKQQLEAEGLDSTAEPKSLPPGLAS